MAGRDNEIGRCRCPVCDSTRARLRVSAKSLAYVTCDTCNAQVFARSDRSDEKLRALHIADAPPAPESTPASTASEKSTFFAPAPEPAPAPAPAPMQSWGAFPWIK